MLKDRIQDTGRWTLGMSCPVKVDDITLLSNEAQQGLVSLVNEKTVQKDFDSPPELHKALPSNIYVVFIGVYPQSITTHL